MQRFATCLWFDGKAEEAAQFYTSLFPHAKIGKIAHYGQAGSEVSGQKKDSVMTVEFEIIGHHVLGLNGGPQFKFTPALSYFVSCQSEKTMITLWEKLSEGGEIRMALDSYPWSQKYGWTSDRFGVDWQLMLSERPQSIAPAFLFVEELYGRGEEAINFYTSVFKNSRIESVNRNDKDHTVLHARFSLDGQDFVLMEGPGKHAFGFSTAFSIVINCDSQEELDSYWEKLVKGGTIEQCGWLKDKFGVSWQVVPSVLEQYMADPQKSEKVMQAMLQMKKLDIAKLQQAAN